MDEIRNDQLLQEDDEPKAGREMRRMEMSTRKIKQDGLDRYFSKKIIELLSSGKPDHLMVDDEKGISCIEAFGILEHTICQIGATIPMDFRDNQRREGKKMDILKESTQIVVETDETNPVTIATITADEVKLADGYRVRLKPESD